MCPTVALHVQWDFPGGVATLPTSPRPHGEPVSRPARSIQISFRISSYKHGRSAIPTRTSGSAPSSIAGKPGDRAQRCGCRDVSLWFADGSNYPGTANIRERKRWFEEALARCTPRSAPTSDCSVEYKPFEPAFYHTDIADWGMALLLARAAGPQAKVLVDTGHHYLSQNIEQIVAWLLDEGMLGGFHFNDRRYADDDLTLGSIDPYQVFRIFHEIRFFEWQTRRARRHRLHDRPEPQPQGQDRSDDSDGR